MTFTQEKIDDLFLDHAVPDNKRYKYPLLFIHGMLTGSWIFRNWMEEAVQEGWECWALNLRGYHGSHPVKDKGATSLKDYVQDARYALGKIGPSILIGHSMGGLIAQIIASKDKKKLVKATVLVTSAPPRGILTRHTPLLLARLWRWRYAYAALAKRSFQNRDADTLRLMLNNMPSSEAKRLISKFADESGLVAREIMIGSIAIDPRSIHCPKLIVGARNDMLTPASIQRKIAKKYNADYFEFSLHAHALMLEKNWQEPIQSILAWLTSKLE